MSKFKVKKKSPLVPDLQKSTEGSSGFDLIAYVLEPVQVPFGKVVKIPTGVSIELDQYCEGQVRMRSGLAQRGLYVVNGVGTIDSDYRGEISVLLSNCTNNLIVIHPGDRIAQLVITKIEPCKPVYVTQLNDSARGLNGFGSTEKLEMMLKQVKDKHEEAWKD